MRKGLPTFEWLPWVSAAVHVTLANLIGGSVLVLIMQGKGDTGLLDGWVKTTGSVVESLGMERRRPYVLAMLGAFGLLPLAVGWWDGHCARQVRSRCRLKFVVPLAALLCMILYVATVQAFLHTSTGYFSVMARNQIWFSQMLVAAYCLFYIPVAFFAAHIVRRLDDRKH